MRCINCGADIKGDKEQGFPQNCRSCGHQRVMRPKETGLADGHVQIAVDRVSDDGKLYFLREHVAWELLRILHHRHRGKRKILVAIAFVGFSVAAVILIFGGEWFFSLGVSIGAVVMALKGIWPVKLPNVLELTDEFLRVNPSPRHVKPGSQIAGLDAQRAPNPAAAGRVLVCSRRAYADFYRANDFEMRAACAVVHGGEKPSGPDVEIVERLKRSIRGEVFLVHDLTPNGMAMADNIRESSHWFGDRTNIDVYDLGLTGDQIGMLDGQWRPLDTIPNSGGGRLSIKGLPRGQGAELAVFRPHRLLKMTWACVEQRLPFQEVDPRRAGGDDGAGGGGG